MPCIIAQTAPLAKAVAHRALLTYNIAMANRIIIGVGIPQQLSAALRGSLNPGLFTFYDSPSAQNLMPLINDHGVDLIFLYNELPDLKNYEELCIALRADGKLETVPILVISKDEQQPQERIRMLNSGLIDGFVSSRTSPEEMAAYANVFLQRRALEEELELKNDLLAKLSITDELTGLHNRRYLIETLGQELHKLQRYEYSFSCIMFDIDFYKKINDEQGHALGDLALENLAAFMKKNIRSADVACRYGGDEIMILFPFTNFESCFITVERLRKKVETTNFGTAGQPLNFTISIGLVSIETKVDLTVDGLLQLLDQQLYEAKNSGRNKVSGILYKPAL
ncbi:MAG TPA: diguanylate cyclase [Candidatus Omnitrophota bacterium]|nr:diguanylate cyclase [Candidatus Omnitrophota bacterium]HQO37829.1 diguanylate cyclase [Candidatus Omnitrophota bacterium]